VSLTFGLGCRMVAVRGAAAHILPRPYSIPKARGSIAGLFAAATGVSCCTIRPCRRIVTNYRDITERKQAEGKLQGQLTRLALLDEITRAIGERQDVSSILQVVIRTLEEHLPAD
jgi:hypothetical protein